MALGIKRDNDYIHIVDEKKTIFSSFFSLVLGTSGNLKKGLVCHVKKVHIAQIFPRQLQKKDEHFYEFVRYYPRQIETCTGIFIRQKKFVPYHYNERYPLQKIFLLTKSDSTR